MKQATIHTVMKKDKFDLNLIIVLGTRGDTEINNVIKNLSIYPNQDNYVLYPFGTAKEKSAENLRREPETTEEVITSKAKEMDLSNYTDTKSLKISFIGHRGNLKPEEIDCFGVMQAENMPQLQSDIINIVKNKISNLEKVQCKYYVCNGLNKINDLLPEFKEKTPKNLNVSIKASANEIVPNPIFLNLKTGLKPEYNNKQNKLENSLPQEYQISQITL